MSKTYEIKMPQLSDTMTEGVVVSWEKQIGDRVERGDIVATVETDKAIMDVEVFREGYLSGPIAAVDGMVPVGDTIALIVATAGEVVSDVADATTSSATSAVAETQTETPAVVHHDTSAVAVQAPDGAVFTIKMPQLSDTMTEGVVVSWEKAPGDAVQRGDIVATVETDKAIMDVEVFREGYLSGPIAPVDSTVPVGGEMAFLVAESGQVLSDTQEAGSRASAPTGSASMSREAAPAAKAQAVSESAPAGHGGAAPAPRPGDRKATPYARQIAGDRGVPLGSLNGSGPEGEIVGRDVLQAAIPAVASSIPVVEVPGNGRKMSSLERAISQKMSGSLTMPTFRVTVDAFPASLIRAAKSQGVSVTVAIAKACAVAMQQVPAMNWAYQPEDKLIERANVDIGMAVAADDGGLVVPVLRGCEEKGLTDLNNDWKDLVGRARNRRLSTEEFSNPTFMISNMGMMGVRQFDAIPTPGIAAILAIAADSPQGMPMTITADHRVVNGAHVAQYLNALKQAIEHPEGWLGPVGPAIPEGDWDYDVIVIGGGPGGEDCARDLAGHGIKVAMVNDAPFPGGECLWRGCIPSKAWRAAADRMRDRAGDARLGILGTAEPSLDWETLEQTRRQVLEERGEMALKTDTGVKIKVIQGFASFVDDHHVFIDTSGNSENPHSRAELANGSQGETLSFGCAVIATGAPPFVPPIDGAREGLAGGAVLTSDTVWNLPAAPKRLVVIGGGAIGLEMAQIFQDFGAEVTLLEAQERILMEVESEVAKQLTGILVEDPRLDVKTSVKVGAIKGMAGDVQVDYTDAEGQNHRLEADYVIMATGKRPVLEPLKLDKAGVRADKGVITADASCRTSVPHIFAVGDVIGGLMLAHTAGQQGRVAAGTMLGVRARYRQERDCGVIFTRPEAAFVGLSAEQAKAANIDAVEVKMPMSIDAKAMITGETHGLIKLVVDKSNHRIIGVHFLADHADTLIGEGVMMVAGEMTLEQVAEAIHPHPTQTELFGEMARRLLARLRRSARTQKKA